MKKIISIMMVAVVAMMAVSCDSDDSNGGDGTGDEYGVTGDKYIGTLTTYYEGRAISTTEDYVLYADRDSEAVDIMMPSAQFVSAMPIIDMAMLDIAITTALNPDVYESATSTMVGIYDHNPLINDIVQDISNVQVTAMYNSTIVVSFDCAVSTETMGDMTAQVQFEGVMESGTTDGFYISISSGVTSEVEDVTVKYYEGDNTLVIDGFKFNNSMPMGSTLVIDGLDETVDVDLTTISGDDISISYTVMYQPCTSNITDLVCSVTDGEAQLEFYILYDEFNYTCTYYGDITIEEGSYSAE